MIFNHLAKLFVPGSFFRQSRAIERLLSHQFLEAGQATCVQLTPGNGTLHGAPGLTAMTAICEAALCVLCCYISKRGDYALVAIRQLQLAHTRHVHKQSTAWKQV